MYGYIIGKISKITPKFIIIENNGIGYLLLVSNPYIFVLGNEYKVYLYQNVRQDAIELYGFQLESEKDLFIKLISVNGIGPKTALSILASGTVDEIIGAIETNNDTYLKKFPGIGIKSSQQIILDLKGKLDFEKIDFKGRKEIEEVGLALEALGYNKKEISKVIGKLDLNRPQGELIKDALKLMIK